MIYNMFPTQIYKCKIDPGSYEKESIIQRCTENYAKKPYKNAWDDKSDLHHYYADWMEAPDIKSLGKSYGKAINDFMCEIKGTFKYRWKTINLAVNTKYMAYHDHYYRIDGWQGMFGTCHYISYDPDQHRPTKFINPLIFGQYNYNTQDIGRVLDKSDPGNSTWYPEITMDIEEDDMIIFPSYLKHVVENGFKPGTKPRILGVCNVDWKIQGD